MIQSYAPTTTHDDEEVEAFYEDISEAMEENRAHYRILAGDFNAKLGKREDVAETSIRNYGYDQRNERGDTLLNFLQHNIYAMNSFFPGKPHRKWTWAADCGRKDHRMVRAKVILNTRTERQNMVKKKFRVNIDRLKQ